MERKTFAAADGKEISYAVFADVKQPKAVLQIVHGMVEHIGRYSDFARFMNEHGYIVAGADHRAHGLTDKDALGLAGEGDLFENTVSDLLRLTNILKETYNLPVIVLGHSYGSFLTQRYLTEDTEGIVGCVLSGSALMPKGTAKFGRSVAKGKLKKHKDERGSLFAKLTFESYDKKFKEEGINAWMTRDKKIVGEYNVDKLCDFVCSNGFYYYMFNGLCSIADDDNAKIRKDLPLLLIAGDKDGVGANGKLVKKLYKKFADLGLNPQMKLYEGARHEVLNEINRDEVYKDVLAFCDSCTEK